MVYALAIIWLLSNVLGLYLAKQRGYRPGKLACIFGALIGPFSIPFIYLVKPYREHKAH